MPSTHLSLYYHIVFSTKSRHPYIKEIWEARLHSYLGGIIRGLGGIAIAIGGIEDHVHIEARLKATHCLANVVQEIKAKSSGWIHRVIGSSLFGWQYGYGGFTVSSSEVEAIKQYILSQKEHHHKRSFQEEYLELLKQAGIEFDERYLW
jgi:REP element-mobilizing transposase RayT